MSEVVDVTTQLIKNLRAFDTETELFRAGAMAPPLVCGSAAMVDEKTNNLVGWITDSPWIEAEEFLTRDDIILVGANLAFDAGVLGSHDERLVPLIFKAYRDGRVFDVLIAESLNAIFHGTLGRDPRTGGELRDPVSGRPNKRYSLAICTDLVLGRTDAKSNDAWRKSYALLEDFPIERWPEEARKYPVDDAVNTLEVAIAQLCGGVGQHEWRTSGSDEDKTVCVKCDVELTMSMPPPCTVPGEPYRNLGDLPAQARAALALHLGACWGIRVNGASLEALRAKNEKLLETAKERFKKKGWLRPDINPETGRPDPKAGREDTAAIKKSLALAFGAAGTCPRCDGTGKVRNVTQTECRGPKIKGRYQGCLAETCVCGGRGTVDKIGNEVGCKAYGPSPSEGVLGEFLGGCDGSGFDLTQSPWVPRSPSGGIKTDRDSKMESGDEELMAFGADDYSKILTTYIPYLAKGVDGVINLRPNVLVSSARCSYGADDKGEGGDPIHQFPRAGGVRECVEAREGRVWVATDYAAGELCTLSQLTLWVVGHSQMAEMINRTQDPGSLHTLLASQMMGVSFEETKALISAGDERAKGFRQAAKCFHPDTEILTRKRGWVRIADLTMDDEVAAVEPKEERPPAETRPRDTLGRMAPVEGRTREWWAKNGSKLPIPTMKIVWTKPTRLTTRKATEGLLHLKNYSIDLRVTPDHRMLTYGGTKFLKTVEARDFGKQRGWFNAGMCESGEIEVDERLLRLAVAAQADGTYLVHGEMQKRIRFGFSKKRKIDRLASLLRDGEYKRGTSRNGKWGLTTTFYLTEELSRKVQDLLDDDKTLPWWWIELTPVLRTVAIDEAKHWDSTQSAKMKCYHFSTTLKKNSDVLQALGSITNRKTTYVKPTERTNDEHALCHVLSVKTKYDTRGENVEITKLDYDGDVYCLSVPSEHILVRDGGIPVITLNCGNFGLPGGMGAATFVLSKRKRIEGETTAPDGTVYAGIRFCVLIAGKERCGIERVTEWKGRDCTPVCKACLEVVEDILKPSFFKTYPEVREYLNLVNVWMDTGYEDAHHKMPPGTVPCFVYDPETGGPKIIRFRGGCTYSAGANNGFQTLLADIGKQAFWRMTWEGYMGTRWNDDNAPSPLAGGRFPLFLHDEPLAELYEDTAYLGGPRIAELMIESGRELAPDVFWKAEPAMSKVWAKNAAPVYKDGKLVLWTPKEKH